MVGFEWEKVKSWHLRVLPSYLDSNERTTVLLGMVFRLQKKLHPRGHSNQILERVASLETTVEVETLDPVVEYVSLTEVAALSEE